MVPECYCCVLRQPVAFARTEEVGSSFTRAGIVRQFTSLFPQNSVYCAVLWLNGKRLHLTLVFNLPGQPGTRGQDATYTQPGLKSQDQGEITGRGGSLLLCQTTEVQRRAGPRLHKPGETRRPHVFRFPKSKWHHRGNIIKACPVNQSSVQV